VSKNRFWIQP